MTALLEIINLLTVLFESFDLFFITFSGGKEHLFQMPHPRFDILLIIRVSGNNIV